MAKDNQLNIIIVKGVLLAFHIFYYSFMGSDGAMCMFLGRPFRCTEHFGCSMCATFYCNWAQVDLWNTMPWWFRSIDHTKGDTLRSC